MGEVPGAEQELRGLGVRLLEQVRVIAAHVTPDTVVPDSALPDLPEVAEWTEPLRYRYSVRVQTALAAGDSAAAAVRRGAEVLAAGGFELAEDRRAGTVASRVVVTGSRDGFLIEVRVWPETGDVVYAGLTPTLALRTPGARQPDPARTAETVEPGHVLCYECDGLGWCPACGGNGWVLDDAGLRRPCPECHEQRVCPICRGAGQLQVARLRPAERAMYPQLSDGSTEQGRS
ncbi:hypothetical protein AB0H58_04995 [Nocardia neocaledoniensis]|uniref:hypothetical protein n=1 Tax=Nocardia neocaledoniensis TaxID=236511 RepID=UPI0033CB282A